jgi:hypothetical protein
LATIAIGIENAKTARQVHRTGRQVHRTGRKDFAP